MQARRARRIIGLALAAILALSLALSGAASHSRAAAPVDATPLRITQMLNADWKFVQDDTLTDEQALLASGDGWTTVTLPHTWNAQDAASLDARSYKRGIGWYRLSFATPSQGARHWLEFGAASLVADVWLNGHKLGQHKGGFTAFRFDITDLLDGGGENVLLVKVNNTEPVRDDDLTAIAPLGGDFNVSGGLYRYVSLISTADPVHFSLADMGGPGVYATTTSIAGANAVLDVETKLTSDSDRAGDYIVRVSLLDDTGRVAATNEQTISLQPATQGNVAGLVEVPAAHLWNGVLDPYLYSLVADLRTADGRPIDKVVQSFGIRQMRFDPDRGFFLNGAHLRLHGVAMHQDYLGKAWAQSPEDWDTSFALIREMGANAVRFGHYAFPQYALEKANRLGLVVWAEAALGIGTTLGTGATEREVAGGTASQADPCAPRDATKEYVDNAQQQLEEEIRQQYNHASVALWSVGNETSQRQDGCGRRYDNVTPVLRAMHARAKAVDPSRPTAYAEFPTPIRRAGPLATQGITDIFGTNRYILWYNSDFAELEPVLEGLHALTNQPLGVTEYGAGAAVTHHSDQVDGWPLPGYPDTHSAPEGKVAYQPEEYAGYVHEKNYRLLETKDYLWGAFVWNMFDFGSAHRNEGDVQGVNTKGLVTFDRQTRKDPFYFYKANWSQEPVTYIVGARYTDRAYALNDVKVYSNADSVDLSINGAIVATKTADQCNVRTCVFAAVRLSPGENTVVAVGHHGGNTSRHEVSWNLRSKDVNIVAGQIVSGLMSASGDRFGSDKFFDGGTYVRDNSDNVRGTNEPQLYGDYRQGRFDYLIPLDNGTYTVRLGFIEPGENTAPGERVFDVNANNTPVLQGFDIRREAGGTRLAVTRTFRVEVSNGLLDLGFVPLRGGAEVSNIMVHAE